MSRRMTIVANISIPTTVSSEIMLPFYFEHVAILNKFCFQPPLQLSVVTCPMGYIPR
jgi:hypothetical protein